MKKSILVVGVSGSGKSSLSRKLEELGHKAYDIDDIPGLFAMIDKETKEPLKDHDNASLEKVKRMDWICDKVKLMSLIRNESRELAFYCGTASNLEEIIPLFDILFMLKANPEITRKRLTHRTANDFGKIAEVQDWIMSWKDWWENEMEGKGAIAIDANRDLDLVAHEIIDKSIAMIQSGENNSI